MVGSSNCTHSKEHILSLLCSPDPVAIGPSLLTPVLLQYTVLFVCVCVRACVRVRARVCVRARSYLFCLCPVSYSVPGCKKKIRDQSPRVNHTDQERLPIVGG
jgi:hypothetical protein